MVVAAADPRLANRITDRVKGGGLSFEVTPPYSIDPRTPAGAVVALDTGALQMLRRIPRRTLLVLAGKVVPIAALRAVAAGSIVSVR